MEKIVGSPMTEDLQEERYIIGLLRHIFLTEPTRELLQDIRSLPDVTEENEIDSGLNVLIQAVRKNEKRLDKYAEELAIEFARLFIGPKNPPAIPYASFYLSETKTIMSDVTIDVRKRYLDAGMAVKDLYSTPDDFIGIELEFIYYLTEKITELLEQGEQFESARLAEIRKIFLKEHMALWVPSFVERILEFTREDFYRGAAIILRKVAADVE